MLLPFKARQHIHHIDANFINIVSAFHNKQCWDIQISDHLSGGEEIVCGQLEKS